ncbi:MAG: hypothetical protein Q8Q49_05435 [bacterium]|nr:hypothetical protein [bacterium]
MRQNLFLWAVIFSLLAGIFLIRYAIVGQAVYGDGIYYWGYTRSLVLDHDLDLRNEGAHTYSPEINNSESVVHPTERTNLLNGRYYPIGTSLLWLPLFYLLHFLTKLLFTFGLPAIPNGYSDIYQIGIGLLNVGFVIGGTALNYKTLLFYFKGNIAKLTALAILFSSNLFYYGSIDVINSHPLSFFFSSLFCYLFVQSLKKRTYRMWLVLGTLSGILAIIRLQDGLFGLLLISQVIGMFFTNRRKNISQNILGLLLAGFGGVVGFAPQFITSHLIYHFPLTLPYTFQLELFHIRDPKLLELIFDTSRGLLFYSPVYIISFLGLCVLPKSLRVVQVAFIPTIVASYLLVSIWPAWSQGESYGIRMFISLLPLLSFGLAVVLQALANRFSRAVLAFILGAFILHNVIMILGFHLFLHSPTYVGEDISRSGKLKMRILDRFSQNK